MPENEKTILNIMLIQNSFKEGEYSQKTEVGSLLRYFNSGQPFLYNRFFTTLHDVANDSFLELRSSDF